MNYVPGQRWISDAEPELGLGTVLRCDDRTVQVLFAKSGVLRTYAGNGAPLSRAAFRVGQRVSGRGVSFVVERIDLRDGLLVYSGEKRELAEGQLDDEQSASHADARLISARIDKPLDYELRKQALHARAAARRSPAWGMLSARVDLLPHQLNVVAAGMERHFPRVLLADEAGLGKTVEAGMILARMLASGRAARVLILVPDTLVVQWFVEMRRRFQLDFAMLDEARCEAVENANPGDNPFEDEQLVLASLPWLVDRPRRAQQALAAGWDMAVVDEAHHLEWTPQSASPAYRVVEPFAAASPGLILLTATPEQLGRSGHFARLRLLDPARYTDLERYQAEADGYLALSPVAERIAASAPLSDADRGMLRGRYPEDQALHALLDDYPGSARELLDALIDRHGTGRVMFRNRRTGVGGFPGRRAVIDLLETSGEDEPLRQMLLAEFHADLAGAAPETGFDYADDPRIAWLIALLDAHPGDKFLLICTSRSKIAGIESMLRTRSGVKTAVFHEGMPLLQRDRAAAWFAQADGARLLLCSESGSEGRNFQFAHRLILWDLPLDPDLLEQRIGRLDRIGQRETVTLHVPCPAGTAQEVLVRWHAEGTGVLRESPADGRVLLRRFGGSVRRVAEAHARIGESDDPELDELIAETARAHAQLSHEVQAGRDRLLELAVSRHGGDGLLAAMREGDADPAGQDLMQRVFEPFGVHAEDLGDCSFVLDPEHLATDALPGFADGPRRATFDRALALAREDLELLRMDHPLVTGALDLLLGGEHGNTAFLVDPALPPRSVLLEAVYVVECVAAHSLDVPRFLPPTPVTVCVNSRLAARDYTPSPQSLQRSRERVLDIGRYRRHLAQLVPPMLLQADKLAAERARETVATALTQARTSQDARVQRLRALAAVNPSISDQEIAAAESRRDALLAALSGARPRLDAVRMAVSGDFLTLK